MSLSGRCAACCCACGVVWCCVVSCAALPLTCCPAMCGGVSKQQHDWCAHVCPPGCRCAIYMHGGLSSWQAPCPCVCGWWVVGDASLSSLLCRWLAGCRTLLSFVLVVGCSMQQCSRSLSSLHMQLSYHACCCSARVMCWLVHVFVPPAVTCVVACAALSTTLMVGGGP